MSPILAALGWRRHQKYPQPSFIYEIAL